MNLDFTYYKDTQRYEIILYTTYNTFKQEKENKQSYYTKSEKI